MAEVYFSVAVEIVDTAGQEDIGEIRKLAYRGAHVLIVCYDVSSPTSFKNVASMVLYFSFPFHKVFKKWIPELRVQNLSETL